MHCPSCGMSMRRPRSVLGAWLGWDWAASKSRKGTVPRIVVAPPVRAPGRRQGTGVKEKHRL